MKAVLLISGRMYGGGQKVVLDLLRELRIKNALDVSLILLGCHERALGTVASHVVPYDGRYNRLSSLFRTAYRLRKLLNAERPDVLHSHGWDADVIGWLAILGTSTRQIVHLHVTPKWLESKRAKHRARRLLTRLMMARAETVLIAVSNAVRKHWAEHLPWNPEGLTVLHNSVDASDFSAAGNRTKRTDKCPVLGIVARLEPMKGIEYLLDALAFIAAEHPDIRLRIAGQGGLRQSLQSRASELGMVKNVEFLGQVQDMKTFYRSIDALVLPSIHTEGLPLAILEAMAAELPVVATTVGGTPEVIRDGLDGFLVPPTDSKALSDAILQLMADPSLIVRMGRNARQRVSTNFSLAKSANAVLELYCSAKGKANA